MSGDAIIFVTECLMNAALIGFGFYLGRNF
jgi:hypothetical protein